MSRSENFESLKTLARFPFALRGFMQQRMTLDRARQIIRERMTRRADNFLEVAERGIYQNPTSPYLPLLRTVRCEFQDLCALVKQKGVDGALRELRAAGVYITFEEFKGRSPVVRNGLTFAVNSSDFDNPFLPRLFSAESGGSTGKPTPIPMNLEGIAARAANTMIADDAYDLLNAPTVLWRGIIPDSTLNLILQTTQTGRRVTRWFSNIGLRDSKHWVKYALANYYILAWIRLYGGRVPLPEYASPAQARVVAAAVSEILASEGRCMLRGAISNMLRVCLAASEAGFNLQGLTIVSAGEPCTPAKVTAIEKTGARFIPSYAMVEAGTLGFGCPRRAEFDDVHVLQDTFALFTHPYRVQGFDITVPSVNVTTLLPTARKILLNLQLDDYATLEERKCGCALEQYGYGTHLHHIRSYRKLTGEGVSLIGGDMLRVLEEVLPARFGGSALDYQLSEQEDEHGFTRLVLRIHPRLAIPNQDQVIETVMLTLRESSAMADSARAVWQKVDALQIERAEPILTARGKLLPLHLPHNFSSPYPSERRT